MIFLDTNVLPRHGSLKNALMSATLKVASHNRLEVHISEVVLEESINIRKELTSEAIQKLQDAFNQASKLMELESLYIPDSTEVVASWREELESAFKIVPLDGRQAIEALKREASRRRPAREGKGARDSAIWLSLLDTAVGYGGPVHFVSDNKDDFADTSNPKILHPDLLEDCKSRGIEVIYHRNLDSLLDTLSKKVDATPAVESVNSALDVLLEALFSAGLVNDISDHFHSGRSILLDAKVNSTKKVKSYQVEDAILSLVNMQLDVTTELADETDPPKVTVSASCRAWVQSSVATGAITSIDIEQVTSLQPR